MIKKYSSIRPQQYQAYTDLLIDFVKQFPQRTEFSCTLGANVWIDLPGIVDDLAAGGEKKAKALRRFKTAVSVLASELKPTYRKQVDAAVDSRLRSLKEENE